MSTDGTSPRTRSALLVVVLAVATALLGLTVNPRVSAQVAAQCDTDSVEVGIVKATGCFTKRVPNGDTDPVFDTTAAFRMNGFDVAPHAGTTVTFTPAAGKRGASVTTNNGFVDLTATSKSGTWGTIHFNNMVFSFTPPKTGEVVIATSALAQPLPVITGLTPLAVSQPITLTDEGAKFDLSFSVGSFFLELVSGSEKEMAASIGFEVQDGKFSIASGKFSVGKFTLAKLLTVNEGSLEIGADKFDIDGDGVFTAVSGFGVVFGTTIEGNQMKRATLGISEINKPLGSSGVYLQKLAVSLFPSPPYGGSGTIGLSAGPKTSFFGRKVTAVEAEGTVEVRGEDTANRKPAYFTVGGKFSLMTLPVGNASFSYYFGQGTRMSANVGIGLPSGTNDPNQPTYVGGGFSGWTSAQHFDLEGDAKLKLLGIDLLGAKTVVSDIGFAGCLQVVAWIGGGVRWSDGRGELLGGWTCNIGGYQPQPGAAQKMNDGQMRMRLDDEVRVIRVRAPEGEPAPQIQFSQRGGPQLSSPAPGDDDGMQRFEGGASISHENVTSLIVKGDATGQWTLRQLPGSSGVETVATAGVLRKPRVDAWVTGGGHKRTLHWDAREIKHQKLQFSETLPSGLEVPILSTERASGTARFTPTQGPGTYNKRRPISVDVRQRLNTPRDTFTAGHYRVRRLAAPAKVRGLQIHRRVADLVADWKPVKGAESYRIEATAVGAGATYVSDVPARRTRARLSVATTDQMRVKVFAINSQDRAGAAAVRRIDTERIVPNLRTAARRTADSATWNRGRRVFVDAPCPDRGSCEGMVRIVSDAGTVGRSAFSVPPDLTDRVVLKLDSRPSADSRVVVRMAQKNRQSRARAQLS